MPKVALLEYSVDWDYEYSRKVIDNLTEWTEISDEDLRILHKYIPHSRWIVLVRPDHQEEIIVKTVADGIKLAKKEQEASEARKKALAEKKRKKEEDKLKKALADKQKLLADKQKLYEQLRAELGEVPDVLK